MSKSKFHNIWHINNQMSSSNEDDDAEESHTVPAVMTFIHESQGCNRLKAPGSRAKDTR